MAKDKPCPNPKCSSGEILSTFHNKKDDYLYQELIECPTCKGTGIDPDSKTKEGDDG